MPVLTDGGVAHGSLFEKARTGKLIESDRSAKVVFREDVPPPEGYTPPEAFRSILGRSRIGLDIESKDPGIHEFGSGAHDRSRGGFVTGVAVAYDVTDATYYPVAHRSQNMADPDAMFRQLAAESEQFDGEIVGANLQYDLDWLGTRHGIYFPKARFRDVQIAEPLLDENKLTYRLKVLLQEYGVSPKVTADLDGQYGSGWIENMDKVHGGHAAVYGSGDTTSPWELFDLQAARLNEEGLWSLFEMESALTPLLLRMRNVGVRVDLDRAQQAYEESGRQLQELQDEIKRVSGRSVDLWAADSIALAFDAMDMEYLKTKTGKPSFVKEWLEAHPSKLAQLIVDARAIDKISGTFIKSYILDGAIQHGDEWRIHAMFNQLKSDGGGTVSGRFSSSGPNLQNIPTRHPILGPLCRSMFIPEDGQLWGSLDWSQIEYRFLVHYAAITPGISADRAVAMYRNDPDTDFHQMASDLTGVPRKQSKNINFGVVYGMGVPKLARSLGVNLREAKEIMAQFHAEAPFMRGMLDMASRRAAKRGVIQTILGRKRRFTTWAATVRDEEGEIVSKVFQNEELAHQAWNAHGNLGRAPSRAFTHKALNSLLQGSAADLMKASMVKMWESGIFEILTPHLTVHDEFNSSVPDNAEGREAFEEMRRIMETTMELQVPVRADGSLGANWSEAK